MQNINTQNNTKTTHNGFINKQTQRTAYKQPRIQCTWMKRHLKLECRWNEMCIVHRHKNTPSVYIPSSAQKVQKQYNPL